MILLWTLVATGVALWLFEGRAWGALRLTTPHGWRLWSAIGLVFALAITYIRTVVRIARTKRPRRIKIANPPCRKTWTTYTIRTQLLGTGIAVGWILRGIIFRGYLIWAFQPLFGLWGAATFSVVVFGMAHAYQGIKGMLASGIVGSLFTVVVLISGSLWPAIVLQALVDIEQGLIAWLVLRRAQGEGYKHPTTR